jgi:hypothetical protein
MGFHETEISGYWRTRRGTYSYVGELEIRYQQFPIQNIWKYTQKKETEKMAAIATPAVGKPSSICYSTVFFINIYYNSAVKF